MTQLNQVAHASHADQDQKYSGAKLLIECLKAHGVKFIFGIPGAKIDSVFDALVDSGIKLIHCRHEQNAAFMAAAYGRITGKPGVVLVTSGPGVSNLATGLLTASTEGDAVIAIGGNVKRNMALKESHQALNNSKLLESVCKLSVEIISSENIPEVVANAFRIATRPKSGAVFISLPQDLIANSTETRPNKITSPIEYGGAPDSLIQALSKKITQAKLPILLLGQEASRPDTCQAVRNLLSYLKIPVIGTYQAAGVIPRELREKLFFGRIGLFKNQPADQLLDQADLVITLGYNPVEYDPEIWNQTAQKNIIHVDYNPVNLHTTYLPQLELIGDLAKTLTQLAEIFRLHPQDFLNHPALAPLRKTITLSHSKISEPSSKNSNKVHPLDFIHHLQEAVDDNTRVISDIGSHYMWLARHFYCHSPRHLLFSNGQQTLGVALPWAMASRLAEPLKSVISISGDGGFLFSGVELETAVREKISLVHFVWDDQSYNMVAEQQRLKYGQDCGVHFGKVDFVGFAKSLGATGFLMTDASQIPNFLKQAEKIMGPVLIHVPIDYRDNPSMFQEIHPETAGH